VDFLAATALFITLGGWFVASVFLGASNVLRRSPELLLTSMVVPLFIVWALTRWVSSIRTATETVPLQVFVGMNGLRVLGGLYLTESGTGIDEAWATPAAIMSIVIGLASIAVAFLAVPATEVYQKIILYLWALIAGSELLGMSIWLIVAAFSDRNSMTELTVMPLFLLPGFITPFMIWSQLTIAGRLWDGRTS
jgi:hypothetical protein